MMGDSLSKLYITIGAKTEQFQKSMDQVSARMQKISTGMKIAGAAITAVGVAGLKLSADARKLNATLGQTALSIGATTGELRAMALELTNVTFSLAEVVSTMDLLARAGIRDKEVIKIVATAFDTLGDAIGSTASVVTDQMIMAMKTYGMTAEEIAAITDKVTYLVRNTILSMDDFASVVGYITPELVDMGLTMSDTISLLGIMEGKGVSGAVATRAFRTAITEATNEQIPLAEALGVTSAEMDAYQKELDGATGMTQKYADIANEQYGVMDKLKQKMSELAFVMGSLLTPLEPMLIAFTALGPVMIFLSTSIGIATVKWIAHTAAIIASTIAIKAATIAQWAWNVAMAANPIGIILVGIAALVIALVGLSGKWRDTTSEVERQVKEQTRIISEEAEKQKQIINDTYNERIENIDAETQAKIDALQAQKDAILQGERDEQLAAQETAALQEAQAGDQTALIQFVRDARLAALDEEMAAIRLAGEEQKKTEEELRVADLAYQDERLARCEAVNTCIANQAALMDQLALHEMHAGVTGPVVTPEQMGGFTIPKLQLGGLITQPTLAMLGERGPEAVIPLSQDTSIGDTIINVAGPWFIREEADINRIARELYRLQQTRARAAGVA